MLEDHRGRLQINIRGSEIQVQRLEPMKPLIASEDQSGFIRGRHSFSNIRRLPGVILSPSLSNASEAIISLDAEEAFDRVEWAYLILTLRRFGLNKTFILWV